MKKVFLIYSFMLCCTAMLAQKTTIDSTDIKITAGRAGLDENFKLLLKDEDGKDMPVRVRLFASDSVYKAAGLNPKKIYMMVYMANLDTRIKIKNKYTYQAKEISIYYFKDFNVWDIATKYVAQNDYGALKDGTSTIDYDFTGTREIPMSELIEMQKAKEKDSKPRRRKS